MILKTFYFNPYRECAYVLSNEAGQAVIIDAGMYEEREQQRFAEYITQQNLEPIALLITHAHPDHVCGIDYLQQTYKLTAIIQPQEGKLALPQADWHIEVIATPGHKEDCVCYHLPDEKVLFTGDTLFQESIGRTDLPGGDYATLVTALTKKVMTLPDATVVYPGHGPTTTIEKEKMYNAYL